MDMSRARKFTPDTFVRILAYFDTLLMLHGLFPFSLIVLATSSEQFCCLGVVTKTTKKRNRAIHDDINIKYLFI